MEDGRQVSFHSLPIDNSERLKKWFVLMRRDPGPLFKPTKHTKICSRHFKETAFLVTKQGRRFLKANAEPSIFEWTKDKPQRRRLDRKGEITSQSGLQSDKIPSSSGAHNIPNDQEILQQEIIRLKAELEVQKEAAKLFQKERDYIKTQWQESKRETGHFCMAKIRSSDKLVSFYTGFPSYFEFSQCLEVLNPGENGENIIYIDSKNKGAQKKRQPSKPKRLTVEDEFFLVLCRLRLGLFTEDLAQRFGIATSSVNRIWLSWINYMYLKLGNICIWPKQEDIKSTMPDSVKAKYPNLEWIIDAFEIQSQRPLSLVLQSQSYSNYKSRNTLKGLIACTPSGQIGFISQLYQGSISDRELTIRSRFLKMPHNNGAMWLVDKGFQIADLAEPLGVTVNMPAFVGSRSQMTAEEVFQTQQIASERIHVERAINKVKNFHIFDSPQNLSMYGSVNQMWTVCALLTLWQNPIISA